MNIVVCIKQVPDTETRIKLKENGHGINRDNVRFIMNPFDEFALEEAVRIKEKVGGQVVAISMGPDRIKEMLRTSLAIGADKAIHLNDPLLAGGDSYAVAKALSTAIQKLGTHPDLILLGKKAVGVDRGQVGPQLAQMLGLPFVSQIVKFELSADARMCMVHREIEGGRQEVFEVTLPAVLSTEKGLNVLRHAALKGIMMAKNKPIQALTAQDLGLPDDLRKVRLQSMVLPAPRAAGRIVPGETRDAVKELVRLLREEAKVL